MAYDNNWQNISFSRGMNAPSAKKRAFEFPDLAASHVGERRKSNRKAPVKNRDEIARSKKEAWTARDYELREKNLSSDRGE
jgi:hypothetical protein